MCIWVLPSTFKFILLSWLEYSSYCSLPNNHFSYSSSGIPWQEALPELPASQGQIPRPSITCTSLSALSHMVLFSFTQLTRGQVTFQSFWCEQGPDRKEGGCVLETGSRWASRNGDLHSGQVRVRGFCLGINSIQEKGAGKGFLLKFAFYFSHTYSRQKSISDKFSSTHIILKLKL